MTKRYSPEVRERAVVNLVLETQHEHTSQWKAFQSIAPQIGCIPETLHLWIKQHEQRLTVKNSLNADERQLFKALKRENRELRRSNDILRQASAYFAPAKLDRHCKK
ncbi:transposase [Candidatus Erwinia dacicola]